MKATGIVRRIDDLGRVVVPKEIRRILRIREGDPLEIYTGNDGEVILKKYSPIRDMSKIAKEFSEIAASISGTAVMVSDTDHYIASAGNHDDNLTSSKIESDLDKIIQSKHRMTKETTAIFPIVVQGDPIGSITIVAKDQSKLKDSDIKIGEIGAKFLAKQMDS